MASETSPSLLGQTVAGRYVVERRLAAGGMGEVYLARDERLGRQQVVLKSPWPGMMLDDPALGKRFIREIRTMSQLDHPNIVKVFDVAEYDGRPVAVIQYFGGGDLAAQRNLPLERWLPQIADALDYLHGQKLVHRDVKPGNIFFDSHGTPYLGDFGIVKSQDGAATAFVTLHSPTRTGFALGTPQYMAPEAVEGQESDGRADQYALAVMVYERLAGRMPFDASTPMQFFAAHMRDTPHPLSSIDACFGPAITEVLERALSKRREERFESCREFASAVLTALGVALARPSVPSRMETSASEQLRSSTRTTRHSEAVLSSKSLPAVQTDTGKAAGFPRMSMVRMTTTPSGATVMLDGKLCGRSPLAMSLTAGEYRLRVEMEGYTSVERRLSIDGRRDLHVDITLNPPGQAVVGSGGALLQLRQSSERSNNLKEAILDRKRFGLGFLANTFKTTSERILGVGVMAGTGTLIGVFLGWALAGHIGSVIVGFVGGMIGAAIFQAASKEQLFEDRFEHASTGASTPQIAEADHGADDARSKQFDAPMALDALAEITNSVGVKLRLIPPGEFMMGSPESEKGRLDCEGPQHRVRITRPFYLGVYAVTQEQYSRVMGRNPSYFQGSCGFLGLFARADVPTRPVEWVSWNDAVEFCRRLSALPAERSAGREYRLPTEAEWEYVCRAGTTTPFHFGSVLDGRQANCDGNYPYGTSEKGPYLRRTTTVGIYSANGFGLYDMHGNVWEWCSDWFGSNYYANSPLDDPQGPVSGSYRVFRGGSWIGNARGCRSADRDGLTPGNRYYHLGFRLALVPADE